MTNMMYLGSFGGPADSYDYLADWSRFPLRVSWNYERDPFPLELWKLQERARSMIMTSKGVRDAMSLAFVDISRIVPPPRQLEAHGLSVDEFTNQWFVCFVWKLVRQDAETDSQRYERSVVLLDGTFAVERPSSWRSDDATQSTLSTNRIGSNQSNEKLGFNEKFFEQIETRKKTLGEIDLRTNTAAVMEFIKTHPTTYALVLREIYLRFVPVDSSDLKDSEDLVSKFKWIATYSFEEQSVQRNRYEVETRNDGKIMNVRSVNSEKGSVNDNVINH
jgi:hypothetical protein